MRSIIINTLGAAHSRKDVYFLAFAPGQVLWVDTELDQLHDCVQLIQRIQHQQTVIEDYHLIILMNADGFDGAEFDDHRLRLQKVLRAWLVEQLLQPLDELALTPLSASEIIISSKYRDNATSPIRTYSEMLKLDPENIPETICLEYNTINGMPRLLDLTSMLGPDVISFKHSGKDTPATALPTGKPAPSPHRVRARLEEPDDLTATLQESRVLRQQRTIEDSISQTIDQLQSFRLIRNAKQTMPIQTVVFHSQIQDRSAINANLQINVARLVKSADKKGIPDPSVVNWHTPSELAQLLADAEATIWEQISPVSPQPIYFKLEDSLFSESDAAEMELEMRHRLRNEASDVPGVTDALAQWEEQDGNLKQPTADTLIAQAQRELRTGMLLFSRERKRFQERYAMLRSEYNREKVLDDQRRVFDICAGSYTEWRTRERRAKPRRDTSPSEIRRPLLEAEKNKELIAARDRCAEGVLSQLDDYTDVRKEAARIHTEFSSLTRLWSPNLQKLSTRYFYRFSIIMGLAFVVLMVLPFFLISGQASDLKLSRVAAYLINAGVFLTLYAVGFMIWLRKLSKDIRDLRGQLEVLIIKSAQERRESVLQAIATYTRDLPSCLIKQLNYNAMVKTNEENMQASQKYEQHMQLLKDACKEIQDVRTALRAQGFSVVGEPSHRALDLLRAPYDPANQELYMLFAERSVPASVSH